MIVSGGAAPPGDADADATRFHSPPSVGIVRKGVDGCRRSGGVRVKFDTTKLTRMSSQLNTGESRNARVETSGLDRNDSEPTRERSVLTAIDVVSQARHLVRVVPVLDEPVLAEKGGVAEDHRIG